VEQAQASARRTLGDGFRVADGVLGDDAFVQRVARDVRSVEGSLQGGRLQRRLGDPAVPRAELDDVVDAVCAALSVERLALETGSQARELVAARRPQGARPRPRTYRHPCRATRYERANRTASDAGLKSGSSWP
jgi:hypothetical protein